jgi:hypothetical protein
MWFAQTTAAETQRKVQVQLATAVARPTYMNAVALADANTRQEGDVEAAAGLHPRHVAPPPLLLSAALGAQLLLLLLLLLLRIQKGSCCYVGQQDVLAIGQPCH